MTPNVGWCQVHRPGDRYQAKRARTGAQMNRWVLPHSGYGSQGHCQSPRLRVSVDGTHQPYADSRRVCASAPECSRSHEGKLEPVSHLLLPASLEQRAVRRWDSQELCELS